MKKKAFNFVELLLVLLILGVVISLTMPLLKKIKDDDKINKSYERKATQDVSDALALAMIKKPQLTGLDRMTAAGYTADALGLRNLFNTAIPATPCNKNGSDTTIDRKCGIETTFTDNLVKAKPDDKDKNVEITSATPGFTVGGKMVFMFVYDEVEATATTPASYGYVFVDVNGKKLPNELNKDRYSFKLYNDKAVLVK